MKFGLEISESFSIARSAIMANKGRGALTALGIIIGIVAVITWLVLRSSTRIAGYLGITGMNALTRVMGFLLICIGIEFISTGFFEGLTDQLIMGAVVDAVLQAAEQ